MPEPSPQDRMPQAVVDDRWSRLDGLRERWGFAAIVLVLVSPLVLSRYFPGLDLPWHAAIIDMIHLHDDAALAREYLGWFSTELEFSSYLTFYYVVDGLAFVTGDVVIAMQLVIAGYVVGFCYAARSFIRAWGGADAWAVLAAPAAYSMSLEYGFLTYALSFPLTLVLWALVRRSLADSLSVPRAVLMVVLSLVLAITHPFACAIAVSSAGLLCVLALTEPRSRRRAGVALGLMAAGTLPTVLAIATLGGDDYSEHARAIAAMPVFDRLLYQDFTGVSESLVTAPVRLFGFVENWFAWATVVAGLALAGHWWYRGKPARDRDCARFVRHSLVFLFAWLVLLYLITPYTFYYPRQWIGAQPRLLPLVWIAGLALLRWRPAVTTRAKRLHFVSTAGYALVVFGGMAATTLVPFAVETWDFRDVVSQSDRRVHTLALIEQAPPVDDRAALMAQPLRYPPRAFHHFGAYLPVEAGGYVSYLPMISSATGNAGVLVPVKFTGKQPLPRGPLQSEPRGFRYERDSPGWQQFLIRDLDPEQPHDYFRGHEGEVELVAQAGRWRLFRKSSK